GEGFARAALPDPQCDAVPVPYLHVPRVYPVGESRVVLEQRTLHRHRRLPDVGNQLDGVWIAHGQNREVQGFAFELKLFMQIFDRGRTHVDADFAVVLQAWRNRPAQGLDADLALRSEPPRVNELHEAARAVAALLHLAAVGVEDAVAEIEAGLARLFDDQDLIGAHAEMTIRKLADVLRGKRKNFLRKIQDHEVVPGALHLRERELHRVAAWRARRSATRLPISSASAMTRRPCSP